MYKERKEDNVAPEMLKELDIKTKDELRKLFNRCLMEGKIPKSWENAIIVLIYKKGDPTDLENFRPIALLSQIYKLFMRIIMNRLEQKFELYLSNEQAGFRKNYSTVEHLHTVKLLIEKTNEYNLPLWMAFIDFRKAFDTVEYWSIIKALRNARIDQRYINIIKHIQQTATIQIKLHETTGKVKINRGVRQGDIISPKLFTLVLETVFAKLDWDKKGINIHGEWLSKLKFADDVVIFAQNRRDLIDMLNNLKSEAEKVGLQMNMSKTKFMTNEHTDGNKLTIANEEIEQVNTYVYLGQSINITKQNQEAEIERRVRLSWAAYGKLKSIINSNIPLNLKTKLYNECILPVTTYGAETWVLNQQTLNKLQVHQRAMERRLLGISLKDRKTNEWIRSKTKVMDITTRVSTLKWNWAGHVARHNEKWSNKVTRWRPWGMKRSVGRPKQRWYDDLKRTAGLNWYQTAQNREAWRSMREAYTQRVENG